LVVALKALAAHPSAISASNPLGFYVAHQNLSAIFDVSFDPNLKPNESLSIIATNYDAGTQPQWLTAHGDRIYSISRTGYPEEGRQSGGVFAFQRPQDSDAPGKPLKLLSTQSSNGEGGVHCDVSGDGKVLAAANIEASTMAIYPLAVEGSIGEAQYKVQYHLGKPGPGTNDSQVEPFPHQAEFDPSGQFLFVCARGEDKVHVYSVPSPEQVTQLDDIVLPPGSGPRHITFRAVQAAKTYMYLVGELDNTIRVYTVSYNHSSTELSIELHQTISTLGADLLPTLPNNINLAAEIVFTADGRFAYASNRGTGSLDSDTLAVYGVNDWGVPEKHLTYLGSVDTLGKIPRHLALSPDSENRYIAVANEYSNEVVVLERDCETGMVKGLRGRLVFGEVVRRARYGPDCILWK
jgi:6-phosphogluconolactonase